MGASGASEAGGVTASGIGIMAIAELVIGERIKGADNSTFSGKWNGLAVAIKVRSLGFDSQKVSPLFLFILFFYNFPNLIDLLSHKHTDV